MFEKEKKLLLNTLKSQGVSNQKVLDAVNSTPREKFIADNPFHIAYENQALPIDCGQTISQPYIVALMTQTALTQHKTKRVLEIGTGSGYQTAVLAQVFDEVFTIERIEDLYIEASQTLNTLGYRNIKFKLGDGFDGWPEHSPFSAIVVTAAPKTMPFELVKQLDKDHGTLVVPLGDETEQVLKKVVRINDQHVDTNIEGVRFVPMVKGILK